MSTVSAREASRGFSALLDRVERDGEEYTVIRDGKAVARIVPVAATSLSAFLSRRAGHPALDGDFSADASSADPLLTLDVDEPWRD